MGGNAGTYLPNYSIDMEWVLVKKGESEHLVTYIFHVLLLS